MAAGEARVLHGRSKLPVLITDRRGRPQWHDVFIGNPYILRQQPVGGVHINRVFSATGQRPYIRLKTAARWLWHPYQPKAAELFFTRAEKAFAEPYRGMVMVEPNVKSMSHTNKAWIAQRWVELINQLELPWVQCLPGAVPTLPLKVTKVITPTFRHACAVLSVAKAFVGTEGGLMHAAAAVGTPSVILWSEFISPEITGYRTMVNLRHAGNPCGMRSNCRSCRRSMEAITVAEVAAALKGVLK